MPNTSDPFDWANMPVDDEPPTRYRDPGSVIRVHSNGVTVTLDEMSVTFGTLPGSRGPELCILDEHGQPAVYGVDRTDEGYLPYGPREELRREESVSAALVKATRLVLADLAETGDADAPEPDPLFPEPRRGDQTLP